MPKRPPSTEPRIEHVVVLMLENRSFDHMLGFLDHPAPFEGLKNSPYFNVSYTGAHIAASADGEPQEADPDHSHAGVEEQIGPFAGVPNNGGFVHSYEELLASRGEGREGGYRVMKCLDPETRCPILAQLAEQFAVCDAWFCSVPGETWPNRNFAHAATSHGAANIEFGFYYDKTIFEQLASKGASWRIYFDGVAQVMCFRNLWQRSLLRRLLFQIPVVGHFLGGKDPISNWYLHDEFYLHVAAEDLPSYSFIEPHHFNVPGEPVHQTNSQHPHSNRDNAADFYAGESLIQTIYDALVARPSLFERTLLVITYDEHGGWYDHIPPPSATPPGGPVWRGLSRRIAIFVASVLKRLTCKDPVPDPQFAFDRLGVRVPAVLVSPWIKPGTVIHRRLEHASIPRTVRSLFTPSLRSLTRRDRVAGTFHDVVRDNATSTAGPRPRPPLDPGSRADVSGRGEKPSPLPLLQPTKMSEQSVPQAPKPSTEFEFQLMTLNDLVNRELSRRVMKEDGLRLADISTPQLFAAAAAAERLK